MMHIAEFYNKVVKKRIFSDDDQLTQHTYTHALTHSHAPRKQQQNRIE